jgi:UDP-2,3-diacylglucosamine pyrophosphatase LpxH
MVKEAVSFIFEFEKAVAHYVKQRDVDGVICGHIHAATIKELDGITYINCGDWVDSCTAIVEHMDGRMELIEWGVVSAPEVKEKLAAPLTEEPAEDQTRQAA